jgi:hypothetical protein
MYVDSGRYNGLVRLCYGRRWPAGLLYVRRGDEEADGGPREGHIMADSARVIEHKDGACH